MVSKTNHKRIERIKAYLDDHYFIAIMVLGGLAGAALAIIIGIIILLTVFLPVIIWKILGIIGIALFVCFLLGLLIIVVIST
jgi:hypothetical protein